MAYQASVNGQGTTRVPGSHVRGRARTCGVVCDHWRTQVAGIVDGCLSVN